MRTSFFFSFPSSSPLLGQTTPDTRVVVGLLRNSPSIQPSRSPGPGGEPFSFFSCLSRVLLDRQSNKIFHFASLPKTPWFLHITDPPSACSLDRPSLVLVRPGSAHHHPATLPFTLPLAWRSGCLLLDFPSLSRAEPSKAQLSRGSAIDPDQTRSSFVFRHPSRAPHARAAPRLPHPNSSHPRIAGSPFSTYYNHHHQQSQRRRTPAIHS
jgi:hypothetical protein